MEMIRIRSKMTEKNLKDYLLFEQFYAKPYYIRLRAGLAVVIGAVAGIFSPRHLAMFLLITAICLVVLLWFPKMRIGFKAPQIYRRNRSGAFHQGQDFAFGETRVGFKAEDEADYDWTRYEELNRVIETNTLLILEYTPQQRAIVAKSCMEEEEAEGIRQMIQACIGDRYTKIDRL